MIGMIIFLLFLFFLTFMNHKIAVEGGALTPLYLFHSCHKYFGISHEIISESSPNHIANVHLRTWILFIIRIT